MSRDLTSYQKKLQVPHAFQAVLDLDYVEVDCFSRPGEEIIVPARTLLSQLL